MIEYKIIKGEINISIEPQPIGVLLEDKLVGIIKPVKGGWQYFPKGQKTGGEIFKTVQEVQKTLP